jgi:hypothetical protein
VTAHTLFVLSHDLTRRAAFHDVVLPSDLRLGAGYGSRTIVSDWLEQGFARGLKDGTKVLTVGTVATHTVSDECDAEQMGFNPLIPA